MKNGYCKQANDEKKVASAVLQIKKVERLLRLELAQEMSTNAIEYVITKHNLNPLLTKESLNLASTSSALSSEYIQEFISLHRRSKHVRTAFYGTFLHAEI